MPMILGYNRKMPIKGGSIALILIQFFALSTIGGTLTPKVSATTSDADTKTSHPDFPELQLEENVGSDLFNKTDDFEPQFVAGEVLVKFNQNISVHIEGGVVKTGIKPIDNLNKMYKVSEIRRIFGSVYKLIIPKDLDVLYAAREYELDPFVEYAEPNGFARTFLVPNDANYTQQWAHQIIESEDAWNVTTGDPNVVIAVVDSGVDYNHPDLAANIWMNVDEIPDNGIDDDQNGFVDDVRGWDFVEALPPVYPGEDGTEPDNDPMDFLGHGTFVAGVAAAVGNNEIGVAGVTWNSKIMAVRSGYATYGGGVLLFDQSAAGIRYAVDNGADIITMSFGGSYRSKVVYDAIKYAYDNGALLVAAAGNDAQRVKTYPAAYEEVVAVTWTDQYDSPAYSTNFGNWVEVAAPGVDILSTVSPNASIGPFKLEYPYDYASGSSTAAPHVAGVAALILSRFPYMSRDQVRVQLRRTAVDLPPEGFDNYYGYGRISAGEAVKQAPAEHDLLVSSWKLPLVSKPGDTVAINTTVLNFGNKTENQIKVKLLVNGTEEDSNRITALKSGELATVSCSWTPIAVGTYNVTAYVEPTAKELSNVTDNNAQFAYSWVSYDKAVRVPEDFPTIQEAIDTANLGIYGGAATIRVSNGTYFEYDLLIQGMLTSLTLAGENSRTTIISGLPNFAGVWINVDNVTIKGLTIKSSSVGVVVWSGNNIISGTNLTNNGYGIQAIRYYNNTIRDNIMSENTQYGMRVAMSSRDTIINNTVSGSTYGLYLSSANKTLVSNNTFTDNYYGIWIKNSNDDVLKNNTLTDNAYGFGVEGYTLSQFLHDIDTTNTVDGKAIYYLTNQSNLAINPSTFPNVGYLGLVNSTGVTVRDLTLSKNAHGVMFAYTRDSAIQNVNASSNRYGISIFNSTNDFVINNTITDNYYGIYTSKSTNNTITSNILANDNYGIELSESSGNILGNNTVTNTYRGISVYLDNDNTLEANTVTKSTYGIYLYGCESTSVLANTVVNNTYGIYLYSSESSVLTNNNMTENSYNFSVDGPSLADYFHDIDSSNTVNGKPIYYLINQAYLVIEPSTFPDIGYLGVVNSINITVKNTPPLKNNGQGILFANVTHSSIQEVNASDNYYSMYLLESNTTSVSGNMLSSNVYGIRLINSHNNIIKDNAVTEIDKEGIYLESSGGNTISDNAVTEIDKEGIYLESSGGNTISGNSVSNSSRRGFYSGIILSNSGNNTVGGNTISHNSMGIKLNSGGNNTMNDNSITYNTYGIYLWFCDFGNTIRGNTIADNSKGIYIVSSDDNVIYHNNFINNTSQVYNSASSSSWDDGVEGNYWSDYTGQDMDGDGIGDTPYIIDENNQDNYPLMNLWIGFAYALNLRVMDWDLTDNIQGAYVYVDSDIKISDVNGWANWTEISGTVYVKVKWHGGWVNGTFSVVVDSNKTINIQSNIFDITVTTIEDEQGAVLQNVNVSVYNATNTMIQTGITDSEGKVYLTNVPNSTLTFIARESGSSQKIIGNVTRTITAENQSETIICDQNGIILGQDWDIIADYNTFSLSLIPFPAFPPEKTSNIVRYLKMSIKGLKERVKKICSKPNKRREEVKETHESFNG